jgi:hypothetical protein
MTPDLSEQSKRGWLVLAGTTVLVALVLYILSDGGALAGQVQAAADAHRAITGSETISSRAVRERAANAHLRATIEDLKRNNGFSVDPDFRIPASSSQPGYFFRTRFVEVRQQLSELARATHAGTVFDENLGFENVATVPPDTEAAYLLTMLQLTAKAATIVLSCPNGLDSFAISHGPVLQTGPESQPPLLNEYPLEITMRGGLDDILWILYQFSQHAAGDYPLIIRGLKINSLNAKPRDQISQLDATLQIAGMRFLSPQERDQDPRYPHAVRAVAGPAAGPESRIGVAHP